MGNGPLRPRTPSPRILLVEDSEDLRTLMVMVLECEGYAVDAVATAHEALAWLDRGPYDIVLSDYALPGHTGAWLLREALDRHLVEPQCAIIITAHPNPADTGAFEVLRKPLDFDAFLAHLRELVQPGGNSSRPVAQAARRRHPSSV